MQLQIDYLQTLLGYNARRLSLQAIDVFMQQMSKQPSGERLRIVEFSVLSLILHNPGVTSRQICAELSIAPPNLVGMIQKFERQAWIERQPHPEDGRALGLHLSPSALDLMQAHESAISEAEAQIAPKLTASERRQLLSLLKKALSAP